MNMKTFQDFLRIYAWIKSQDPEVEELPIEGLKSKLALYEKMGMKTDEEIAEFSRYRGRMMRKYVEAGLSGAKFFEIDKIEKRLMLLTDSPKSKELLKEVKMPFPAIFLDIEIDASELPDNLVKLKDMNASVEKIVGMLIVEMKVTDGGNQVISFGNDGLKVVGRQYFLAYGVTHTKDGHQYTSLYDLILPIENEDEGFAKVMYDKMGKLQVKFFRNFLINFGLFINHPEVERIYIDRSDKNAERRRKQGKIVLPSSHKIRLTGKIKQYVNNFRTELEGEGFDHKFWVRGHWRHHYSEKYKQAKGKVIWIAPFIKGRGELVEKTYLVDSDREDENEYKKNFLFLDDIKPLDEPLRKKRMRRENNGGK